MTAPTLDELATLAPDPDDHEDGTVKVRVGDLRALVALIPCARELEMIHARVRTPDLTGQRFGMLVAVRREVKKPSNWLCRCDCGSECVRQSCELLKPSKTTRSCGCHRRRSHRHSSIKNDTQSRRPEYRSWAMMIQRCTNPNDEYWDDYGGRGITVCERWRNSYAAFFEDMGERPAGTTIDRVNTNGNYEPGNCRWATLKQQARNRPELPAGVGYSLLIGSKFCTGYLSNAERHGVIEMLEKLALAWEQEAG